VRLEGKRVISMRSQLTHYIVETFHRNVFTVVSDSSLLILIKTRGNKVTRVYAIAMIIPLVQVGVNSAKLAVSVSIPPNFVREPTILNIGCPHIPCAVTNHHLVDAFSIAVEGNSFVVYLQLFARFQIIEDDHLLRTTNQSSPHFYWC
jgi:hypothetical protein